MCASDLTLSGHEVRYTVFPEQKDQLPGVRKAGGFTVEGDAKHLVSKKTGFAKLDGRKFGFYQEGVVPAAGVLGDALDAERRRVCEAYGVAHTPMAKAIEQYYGFKSSGFYEGTPEAVKKRMFGK